MTEATLVGTAPTVADGHNLYEGMFLLDSGKFATDHDGVTQALLALIAKSGGTVVAHRPWQDGKLAYEIAGHRKGLHYLVYFTMPPAHLTDLGRNCHLSELVLRNLVIKQPQTLFDAMIQALATHDGSQADASDVPFGGDDRGPRGDRGDRRDRGERRDRDEEVPPELSGEDEPPRRRPR